MGVKKIRPGQIAYSLVMHVKPCVETSMVVLVNWLGIGRSALITEHIEYGIYIVHDNVSVFNPASQRLEHSSLCIKVGTEVHIDRQRALVFAPIDAYLAQIALELG